MNVRFVAGEACKDAVTRFPENIPSLAVIREYMIEIKARIEKKNADCVQKTVVMSNTFMSEMNDLTSSEEYNKFDAETFNDDCNVRQRIVKRFPGVGMCYSEKAIHQCSNGCYSRNTVEKDVTFKCYAKSHPTPFADYIMKQITIDVPTLCVRA